MVKQVVFILFLFPICVYSQELDTMELDPVTVMAKPIERYGSGGKRVDLSDGLSGLYGNTDLNTLLQSVSPVYMRQLGASGQVSSVSFRGTGSGHTAVYWNGININSLTLGQTDFSLVPLVAADRLLVQYGSGAALTGTDAIGGSVHLISKTDPVYGLKIGFSQELGSYGLYRTKLEVRSGNPKWQHATKMYLGGIENDFRVQYRDSLYRQNNAASKNLGVLHRTALNLNEQNSLTMDLWVHHMDRELQPKIGDFNNRDQLEDKSLRAILSYSRETDQSGLGLKLGYIMDDQKYNRVESYGTSRWILSGEYDNQWGSKVHYRIGADLTRIQTHVDTYLKDIGETRTDFYASIKYIPGQRIELSANLRKTLVTQFEAPLTPSLGADLFIFKTDKQSFQWRGMISRSYKVPAFNDRYWDPGGNPDLDSEKGWSWETGINHDLKGKNWNLESDFCWFYLSVSDWILWIPQGNLWSPQNVRKVHSSGLEISEKFEIHSRKSLLKFGGDLAWVRSVNESGLSENDGTEGRLLPYTPEWNANFFLTASRGALTWRLNTRFVGERFTEQSNSSPPLASYQLWDSGITFEKELKNIRGALSFTVLNLLDEDYENYVNRGMPGRNYQLGIRLDITKPKLK